MTRLQNGKRLTAICVIAAGLALACLRPALAADVPLPQQFTEVTPASEWSFRITPYGWFPSMKGTQTVKGRSANVDATFIDILQKSDTLVGLMADFEARNGRFSLFSNAVWTKVGLDAGTTRTRSPAPGIAGTVGASLGINYQMAIVELGATYEVARSGALAVDVLAGGRYWYQKADLSLDLAGTIDQGGLVVSGTKAISRSGAIDWLDPLVGMRLRYAAAPGHDLFLRGDIGGFGAASKFSWQAIGGYSFDFAVRNSVTWSGIIGYRALYVDYARGSGQTLYQFDVLQHGPVVGLSARF
ncbi:MAG: hypothetical protein JWM36_30 [Hyphomicrobiales bacterium]|nr:hypothetical protein [Hyphomicrobiales bacterium]